MSSRNASAGAPGPARARPSWPSHLRHISTEHHPHNPAHNHHDTHLLHPHPNSHSQSPDTTASSSNSTIRDRPSSSSTQAPPRKTWSVTIDESHAAGEAVHLNLSLIGDEIKPGSLVAIDVLPSEDRDRGKDGQIGASQERRRYVCVADDMTKAFKTRYPTAEVHVAKRIADAFGMKRNTLVTLTPIDATNPAIEASHLELSFRDQYFSRADMWRMAVGELSGRTVYKGQVISFMESLRAQVTAVYVDGRKVHSAFFGRDTKPIFRSESARFVLFIQMAREMWDFDSDGSGEIMFYKVVNGFLPALFKKWASMKVNHLVTIVLFARVEYDTGISNELGNAAAENRYYTGVQNSGDRRPYKDFYRVVVSEMTSVEWTKILNQLKREFNYFRKDISTHHMRAVTWSPGPAYEDAASREHNLNSIKAEPSRAVHGNFLEAINMASSLFSYDYIDRDLTRTGISVVVISPGPGVFEVDYNALRRTTDAMVGSGIGIDLICIPKIPLHSVPLFRYRAPQQSSLSKRRSKLNISSGSTPKQSASVFGSYSSLSGSYSPGRGSEIILHGQQYGPGVVKDEYVSALPQWLHVSYWTGASEEALSYHGIALSVSDAAQEQGGDDFQIRCRMYDLQMRSVMETNEIETKPLHMDPRFPLKALQEFQVSKPHLDLEGNILVKNIKVPETLFDHVWGFHKFAAERHSKHAAERVMWEQLRKYDESRAKVPSAKKNSSSARPLPYLKQSREHAEQHWRHHGTGDANLLSTSYSDRRPSTSTALPTVQGLTHYHRPSSARLEIPSGDRWGSGGTPAPETKSRTSTASSSPTKAPKLMRQISLGNQGFKIAAPKAAVAELSVESVAAIAARPVLPSHHSHDPRLAPIREAQRPMSRDNMTFGTPSNSPGAFSQFSSNLGNQFQPGTPTKPIVISRPPRVASHMLSGSILSSTLRPEAAHEDRDVRFSKAMRAEDNNRLNKSKLLAEGVPEIPTLLSPTAAMSPWLSVLNPSNPPANDLDMATLYSRWQHVFPRPQEMRIMKWKSLCSPAAVPLTSEYFPSQEKFETEYQRQPYVVSQNPEDDNLETPRSRDELLRELICLRFCQGFQIIVGPAVAKAFGQKQVKVADIFSRDHMMGDGTSIFMSVGNTIHQLSCVNGTEIEVNIFIRKPTASLTETTGQIYEKPRYRPAIRTLMDAAYKTSEIDLVARRSEKNWNYIDAFVAGHHDELTEHLKFWRARYVLIPMANRQLVAKSREGDSDEEIRIEGIRRLAQNWQRNRYYPPNERQFHEPHPRRLKDITPLHIIYKTEDPSVVIAAELETLPLLEGMEGVDRKEQLVRSREQFSRRNFSLAALAEAIQQPVENGGIRMQNRRWHLRLHYNCFIGSDMTSWLLVNFEDLDDREDAVALGNQLMVSDDKEKEKERKGLFVHVEKRHNFRDGQYFYRICDEYAKHTSWFNTKRSLPSMPSTPMGENMPQNPRIGFPRPMSINDDTSHSSGATTPTGPSISTGRRPKVSLSKVIKYNVDLRKKSYRPEIVELHYDRLHNPDNCYHIRVEWMNVTAKLIEDAVERWATIAKDHGLRLVEVPIAEACSINETNPFRRPYVMKLAVPPPDQPPATYYEANSFSPQVQPGRHFYQKAILRKFDFVLDMEAASNFPSNVDVSYSWGKPEFRYTQYIHRSGSVLAEVTHEGDILILANRLYSSRAAAARERERDIQRDLRAEQSYKGDLSTPGPGGPGPGGRGISGYNFPPPPTTPGPLCIPDSSGSPSTKGAFSSPVVRAVMSNPPSAGGGLTPGGGPPLGLGGQLKGSLGPWTWTKQEPEMVRDELEAFCKDVEALEAFYKEVTNVASPPSAPGTCGSGSGVVNPQPTFPVIGTPGTAGTPGHGVVVGTPSGTVPEVNIPVLGLPPGVLTQDGNSSHTGGGNGALAAAMAAHQRTEGTGISPRLGSPALMLASSFMRRRSLAHDNILEGLRMTSSGSGSGAASGDDAYQTKRAARSVAWHKGSFNLLPHSHNKSEHDIRTTSVWQASNRLEGQPLTPSRTLPGNFQYNANVGESSRDAANKITGDSRNSLPQDTLRRRAAGRLSPTAEDPASGAKKETKRKPGGFLKFYKHLTPKEPYTWRNQLKNTIGSSWINLLLLAVPVGFVVNYIPSISRVAVFVINFVAIIPLAAMLGFATEEIALRTGETLGGLLNATFGNAVELIVAIIALIKDEIVIVQTSLIGSILSNLLLVMGMCFFFGGANRKEQFFNTTVAQTAASLLALAVAGVIVPTVFDLAGSAPNGDVAKLSRGTSVILLIVYVAYLVFQLKTHSGVFAEESQKVEGKPFNLRHELPQHAVATGFVAPAGLMGGVGLPNATKEESEKLRELVTSPPPRGDPEEEDETDDPQLHFAVALGVLAMSTVLIGFCAEFMVDGISAITGGGKVSAEFVGLILLPIVGNAAEHATAVTVAIKDKMDLAIGVAVGSSMQVALLIIPLLVIIGWGMDKPAMSLSFDPFQVAVLFVAVLLVNYLIADGKSHWLEGMLLMCLYAIIAVCSWWYPTKQEAAATGSNGGSL
ncbi:vacuolar membrane-associated protein iml-1 [Podospora fimiseda]|uniref:Vacuolar membrane-associated protein IML1 n=1 Tax=Podospora fimiseda TaxID=252190 RepID=A0AAN7BQT9_9PEZI|nr:vacuolar membrane-associated protein iml-1 [Podospora fimiseda]